MDEDKPEDLVHTLLAEALFPGHPLGREVLGTARRSRPSTRDEIAAFLGRWYRPANLVVVAAGDLDHDRRGRPRSAASLGRLTAASGPSARAPDAAGRAPAVLDDPTEQAHLALGWRASTTRRRPLRARGRQPRPRRRHVEPAVPGGPRGAGPVLLGLLVGLDLRRRRRRRSTPAPRRPRSARCSSVDRRRDRQAGRPGITEGELAVAKGYLEGSLVLGLEDSGSRMARLGRSLMARGEIVTVDEQLARIRAVTPDDVGRGGGPGVRRRPGAGRRRPRRGRRARLSPCRIGGAHREMPR